MGIRVRERAEARQELVRGKTYLLADLLELVN